MPDLDSFFTEMEMKGFPCKFLRLDNAGEAKLLEDVCKRHGIKMEYTAPDTPQYNAKVEREFPTIRNMAYASLMASGLSNNEQMLHWAHAVDDATLMRNLQPRGNWANAFEPFDEKVPVRPEHLVKFGA